MDVMGGIDGIAKSGAAHCWMVPQAVAPRQAPFGGGGDCTSHSYGMDRPIWDVFSAPGGAGYGAFRKSGSGRTLGPQNPLSARDVIERSARPHAFGPVCTVCTFLFLLLYYTLLQYYVETVLCL